jgi:glutamate synthase domain-containing protein 2
MGILPIDIQAILVHLDSMRNLGQDGVSLAQSMKGGELRELSQIQSSRVNEVKPHPEANQKIEDEQKKSKTHIRQKREQAKRKKKENIEVFEEPYKGTIIDTIR